MRPTSRGFTLIELLVVIAVIAVLVGLLLPALSQARTQARISACGARLQQIGIGVNLYFNSFDNYLPQLKGPLPGGGEAVIGALFAGKKGLLPFYGIDQFGAERRPLNRYVTSRSLPPDSSGENPDMEEFRSPLDRGAQTTGVPFPPFDKADSMYDLIGASYTLNDHALDGEDKATLVPLGGGRMPYIKQPTKTWVIGTHTIYTYQQDGDRGMYWFDKNRSQEFANLLFADFHVRTKAPVPKGVVNTTPDYTFLP